MLRMSMLGWAGVAFLSVAGVPAASAFAQSIFTLNPRACVIDQMDTDSCPTVQQTTCPAGPCDGEVFLGCNPLNGDPRQLSELTPHNPGATVQAAMEASPGIPGRKPVRPPSPVVCYEISLCFCEELDPGLWTCVVGPSTRFVIYSWKPGKIGCENAESPFE
jgi:hypothetical protein